MKEDQLRNEVASILERRTERGAATTRLTIVSTQLLLLISLSYPSRLRALGSETLQKRTNSSHLCPNSLRDDLREIPVSLPDSSQPNGSQLPRAMPGEEVTRTKKDSESYSCEHLRRCVVSESDSRPSDDASSDESGRSDERRGWEEREEDVGAEEGDGGSMG